MAPERTSNGRKARRVASAAMLVFAFLAILVHGRATRAVQFQTAKLTAPIEALERPQRG